MSAQAQAQAGHRDAADIYLLMMMNFEILRLYAEDLVGVVMSVVVSVVTVTGSVGGRLLAAAAGSDVVREL